ncbi:MAG TPA: LysR family transcriptional regulator [Microbacteriaceae bacterium]|nr:LysR family transcriptional regulator [Microbacteriaceae bacterium]
MAFTLNQLSTFALVAKLGSLRAAAKALGVSEAAVSQAVSALRADLGDELIARGRAGVILTPGGRILADRAERITGLAQEVRRDVKHAATSARELRVLATASFAEHAAGRLIDLFGASMPPTAIDVIVESAVDIPRLLTERVYDIALGAQPAPSRNRGLSVVPFLKYQRVIVASMHHPLARRTDLVAMSDLLAVPWFCGPGTFEPETEEGRWFGGLSTLPDAVELTSENDALAAVASGEGVMLALSHVIAPRLVGGTTGQAAEAGRDLVRLHVAGTPVTGLWSATTLDRDAASESARLLQRAARTPEATNAMISATGSRGLSMRGNKLRAALWSRGLGPPPD